MNTIHYAEITGPISAHLDVILNEFGQLDSLAAKPFSALSVSDEMRLNRAVIFVEETLYRAQIKGVLIEDVQRHLKVIDGFEIEHALTKAVADLMADTTAETTRKMFTKKGAA